MLELVSDIKIKPMHYECLTQRQLLRPLTYLLLLFSFGVNVSLAENNKQPNIIFVFADDMGFGDLGCYGNKLIKTPNLDKMAAEGTLFTNFSVAACVCSPSRVGIMTGQFPARHQIHYAMGANFEHNERFHMPNYLRSDVPTIASLLKKYGYSTAHFGKWHMGATADAPLPSEYGFDESKTHNSNNTSENEQIYKGIEQSEKAGRLIDVTLDFIERQKDKPFYINCWLTEPHAVLAPSEEQMAEYPDLSCRAKGFSSATQVYNSVITDVDFQIGRLIRKLDEWGLSENTLLIFSSDNGPAPIWGIGTVHSGAGKVGPLRGCKASLYEGGIRVPFIVRWPSVIPQNKVDNITVMNGVDLLPTFCSLAGINLPSALKTDGLDMSKALLGDPVKRSKPIMWQYRFSPWGRHIQKSPALAMRDGDWKLMMNPDGSRIELYNLKENPCEVDSKAFEFPEIVERMSKILLDWHNSLPDVESMPESAGSFEYPWPGM